MTTRATQVLKAVHDEAAKAHPMRWVVGLLAIGYAVYRIEKHGAHVGEDLMSAENVFTAAFALFGAYYIPYGRETIKGLASVLPFVRKNGDPNSTLSGGASRSSGKP